VSLAVDLQRETARITNTSTQPLALRDSSSSASAEPGFDQFPADLTLAQARA
jgi:hypothetical protein